MIKTLFTLVGIIILSMVFSVAILAQGSDTVTTKVGGGPKSAPVSSHTDTVSVATDIMNAYNACTGGDTHDPAGTLGTCLHDQLASMGYSSALLQAFETRRLSGMADGCTQCVGYIGLIITLLSGSPNTLQINSASDATSLSTIAAGGVVFQKLPDGADLEPGDIGAHDGGFGHILMVNTVEGNMKFTALESNGNFDCHITSNREINRDGYVFFRRT